MKHPYLIPGMLTVLPALAVALLLISSNPSPRAVAASDLFRCTGSSLYFPVSGIVGWTYGDPASTDTDAHGHRTIHTGADIFADAGAGSPVYAPADGVISRQPGWESVNLVLPAVTNVLTGEAGIEIYLTHFRHVLSQGQTFRAGDIIGFQEGDHIHFSVGAFIGYDDREIDQTQDPSPYFHAALTYNPGVQERYSTAHWCFSLESSTQAPSAPVATQTYIVGPGDTLSAIAELYGVTVDEIAAANGLSDLDYLYLDQELVIPGTGDGGSVAAPVVSSGAQPASDGEPYSYLIEDGDSLFSIAARFDVDADEIVRLNGLSDPDVLAAGDYLLIP